jgi:putative membrane protein
MRNIKFTGYYKSPRHQGGDFGNQMMMRLLIKWLCLTAAILFTAYFLEGITVAGPFSAFLTAAALGILNLFFRPLLFILTLPINVMTLGFFTFVINALMLKMASGLIPGFTVTGFWTAVFGSLLISIVNWVLSALIQEKGMYEYSDESFNADQSDTIELEKKDDKWE